MIENDKNYLAGYVKGFEDCSLINESRVKEVEMHFKTFEIEFLKEANSIICSFSSVIKRKGETTNWEALEMQVTRILKEQHKILYPESYDENGEIKLEYRPTK